MSSACGLHLMGFFIFCVQLPLFSHTAVVPTVPDERPGTCPAIHAFCLMPHERNQCKKDLHCLDNKKCCQGVCVRQCLSPGKDPEVCPSVTPTCTAPAKDQCASDNECTNGRKCCQAGKCGKICLAPNKARAGTCPPVNQFCHDNNYKNQCERDDQCPKQDKCCVQVCGKACVTPLQEKPKNCPANTAICPRILKYLCKNDPDCTGTQKCCLSNCIFKCVEPR